MRYLALADDATAGGSSYDDLVAGAIPIPVLADAIAVTTAQADPGVRNLDRSSDVRNRRSDSQPVSFAAAPSMTFGSRAWFPIVRKLLRKAMGGTAAVTDGVDPEPIETTVQVQQSGNLPAMNGLLVREGQADRMSGLWVDEFTLNAPADEEATIDVTMKGLYHDVDDTGSLVVPNPAGMDDQRWALMLRDVQAFLGAGAGTLIDCLSGFGFTLNNNLSDELRRTHCAGKNVFSAEVDGEEHRLWYPDRHALGAQAITGRLDFGDVRPDRELRRILTHAEKLVVELTGAPIATTPAADEVLRLVIHKQAPTGGGAEPLQREGDQMSSYEFTGWLDDATGKDLEAVFVGAEALV